MRKIILCCLITLALGSLVAISSQAFAQSSGSYDLSWSTIDGGGHTFSTSGGYELGGTIGQPDAGVLSGGGYTLRGGFWGGAASLGASRVYLPIVVR